MTIDEQAATAAQQREPTETQLASAALLIPLFFVILFAACIIGTYHRPHPNNIKVGVVGPATATAPLRAGLQKGAGPAFVIAPVSTVGEAVHEVRRREENAAFVPSLDPRRPATMIVATGGGRLVATAAESLGRAATATQGKQLLVRDVSPLAPGDQIGLGIFLFVIVCTICGYITATVLETVTPRLAPSRRYPMIAGVAVLIPLLAYLIAGLGDGTYRGSAGTIIAFIAVGALYTLIIGVGTRLFQVLLGPAGIFASLTIFVFLNIPSLGATYTQTMLPGFWRFLSHFWIGALTVDAERGILYFGGLGVGGYILGMLAWAALIAAALLLPSSRRLERRREATVAPGTPVPPAPRLVTDP
jgi:hypothetical protein